MEKASVLLSAETILRQSKIELKWEKHIKSMQLSGKHISAAHRFLSLTAGVSLSQNRFSCSVGIELPLHEQCIHSGAINGDDWPFYIRYFAQHRLYHCNIPLGILWNNRIPRKQHYLSRGELQFSFSRLCSEPKRQRALITRNFVSARPM